MKYKFHVIIHILGNLTSHDQASSRYKTGISGNLGLKYDREFLSVGIPQERG